ncbi:MAG TPA: hypothetical protein VGL86_33125 [Polyangia bacterium]
MRTTDRIPGFAICARCGVRRQLASCRSCGLLVCGDCRGQRECAVCYGERLTSTRRAQRHARLRELGRRVAVVGLVAASGATGLGAAFLPDGPLYTSEPTPVELRMVAPAQPVTLETGQQRWSQPLAFHCFAAAQGVTCCVISPRQ